MKGDLIQGVIALGVKTGEFVASRGKDTDVALERKIVDAEYYQAVGEEKIRKMYRAYILFDEDAKEAKYCEEMTDIAGNVGVSIGGIGFGWSKSVFK